MVRELKEELKKKEIEKTADQRKKKDKYFKSVVKYLTAVLTYHRLFYFDPEDRSNFSFFEVGKRLLLKDEIKDKDKNPMLAVKKGFVDHLNGLAKTMLNKSTNGKVLSSINPRDIYKFTS